MKQTRLGGLFCPVLSGTTNTATVKEQEAEVPRAGGAGQAAVEGCPCLDTGTAHVRVRWTALRSAAPATQEPHAEPPTAGRTE